MQEAASQPHPYAFYKLRDLYRSKGDEHGANSVMAQMIELREQRGSRPRFKSEQGLIFLEPEQNMLPQYETYWDKETGYERLSGGALKIQQPAQETASVCKHYIEFSWCKFGASCRYSHPELCDITLNSHGYPLRPGTPDCHLYMEDGHCRFGANCRYNHPEYV